MSVSTQLDGSAISSADFTPTAAEASFQDLVEWMMAGESLALALDDVERRSEKLGQEVLRLLLQAHIARRGVGAVGKAIVVTSKDGEACEHRDHRLDARGVETVFGGVKVSRLGYVAAGAKTVHPIDAELQLPRLSRSYEVQRRVVKAATQGPFDEAAERIRESTGATLCKRTAQKVVEEAAVDVDAFYEGKKAEEPDETGLLVATVDCKGIPMVKRELASKARRKKGQKTNKKKMATVAAVYSQEQRYRDPEDVIASLFAERVKRERRDRDLRPRNKRVWPA